MSKATDLSQLNELTDLEGITDGTNGQVLTTDGSGTFTFEDATGEVTSVDGNTGAVTTLQLGTTSTTALAGDTSIPTATSDLTNDSGFVTSADGGNATTVDGLDVHTGRNNEANKLVRTDGSGYAQMGWINTTSGATTSTIDRIYASSDSYIRYVTPATLKSQLGIRASYAYAGYKDWDNTNSQTTLVNTGLSSISGFTVAVGHDSTTTLFMASMDGDGGRRRAIYCDNSSIYYRQNNTGATNLTANISALDNSEYTRILAWE